MNEGSKIVDRLDRELWLITTQAGERRSGLIAATISNVSLVPDLPRVTVAIAKHHYTHQLIEESDAFAMHLIREDQLEWVWRFGIPSGRDVDKLAGLATSTGRTGSPILTDALAWLDCRVESRMDTGDRTILLAEVLEARQNGEQPPLTFSRLLKIAPAEKLRELKAGMQHDVEIDRKAILIGAAVGRDVIDYWLGDAVDDLRFSSGTKLHEVAPCFSHPTSAFPFDGLAGVD